MIRSLLIVFSLLSVSTFLMCSAGNPGSWSDNANVSTLNNVLKAKWWKQLVAQSKFRRLKSNNGEGMDVSDLLNEEADGNIVTPANYTDKLVKSSTMLSCFYGESQKFITDMFVKIIAGRCKSMGSDESMLDCMERFWETMDVSKSITEKMLLFLTYFHNAIKVKCTKTVIDALESLLPHYDRQKYIKSNYLDDDGAIKTDKFMRDYHYFLDQMDCASKILRNFLVDHCWPSFNVANVKYDNMIDIEDMANFTTQNQSVDTLFETYVQNLHSL